MLVFGVSCNQLPAESGEGPPNPCRPSAALLRFLDTVRRHHDYVLRVDGDVVDLVGQMAFLPSCVDLFPPSASGSCIGPVWLSIQGSLQAHVAQLQLDFPRLRVGYALRRKPLLCSLNPLGVVLYALGLGRRWRLPIGNRAPIDLRPVGFGFGPDGGSGARRADEGAPQGGGDDWRLVAHRLPPLHPIGAGCRMDARGRQVLHDDAAVLADVLVEHPLVGAGVDRRPRVAQYSAVQILDVVSGARQGLLISEDGLRIRLHDVEDHADRRWDHVGAAQEIPRQPRVETGAGLAWCG